ncbi:hypothetical protein [Ferrovibrio sp.]|uniref:hypothetical protein n=1 Tax=Ferrovibrio sp. TaxID=1917215 RepID=UPI0025C55979|nr:hypothetical protein [Ferrovibrio sp.]
MAFINLDAELLGMPKIREASVTDTSSRFGAKSRKMAVALASVLIFCLKVPLCKTRVDNNGIIAILQAVSLETRLGT